MQDKIRVKYVYEHLQNGDCIGFYHKFAPAHYLIKKCTRGGFGHLGVVCNVKRPNVWHTTFDLVHIKSKFLSFNFFDKGFEFRIDKCEVMGDKFYYKGEQWSQGLQLIKCPQELSEEQNGALYQLAKYLQPKAKYSVLLAIFSTANENTKWRAKICEWEYNRIKAKGLIPLFCSQACDYIYEKVLDSYEHTNDNFLDTMEFLNKAVKLGGKVYEVVNK